MNQISELNLIEVEVSEQNLFGIQAEDAITELTCAQLLMVGGGASIVLE